MRLSPLRVFPVLLLMAGCRGKLVATAELAGPGTAETVFVNSGKKLVLTADTDGTWNGPKSSALEVRYEIDFTSAEGTKAHVSCGTAERRGTTVCGATVNMGASHEADCEVVLRCMIPVMPPGEVKVHVVGTKGENAVLIRKMSLNVREE